MESLELKSALTYAYASLSPFSDKYKVDYSRYLFSLKLLTGIPNVKNMRVLDVGTGIGIIPLTLKKLGIDATGLDYYVLPEHENEMFKVADIEQLKNIWQANKLQMLHSNIYNTEIPKNVTGYNVIISEATIEHVKDPRQFLETCRKLLVPKGTLVLTTPNIATLVKRLRFLFGLSPNWPIADFYRDGENFTGHWREYTMPELKFMCQSSGFEILETYNKNFLTPYKGIREWKKNLRALASSLSLAIPGSREMHYLVCKKL